MKFRKRTSLWAVVACSSVLLFSLTSASYAITLAADDLLIATPSVAPEVFSLEVYLELTGPDLLLDTYTVDVQLSGPDAGGDVAITGYGPTTVRTQAALAEDTFIGTILEPTLLSYTAQDPPNTASVTDGQGLVRIDFTVQPGAVGTYQFKILDRDDGFTLLNHPVDGVYAFDTSTASVTIVPEPQGFVLLGGLAAAAFCRRRRRRR
jgi:hypothetical protein